MLLHILISYVFFCLFNISMLYQRKFLCLILNVEVMKRRQPHRPVKNLGTLVFFFKQPVTFLLCQNTLLLVYLGLCRRTPKSQCIVFVQQQGILQNEEKSGFNRRLGGHQMAACHNRPFISGGWWQLWSVCDAGNKKIVVYLSFSAVSTSDFVSNINIWCFLCRWPGRLWKTFQKFRKILT